MTRFEQIYNFLKNTDYLVHGFLSSVPIHYNCKVLKDQFGNFVFCPFLKRFVDWEYWNGTCPEDCPKLNN